jgi:hypothetical protein
MCDYSLMGVPNRLAKEGEELIVYSFPTCSKGLTSPAEVALVSPKRKVRSLLWEELKSMLRIRQMHTVGAVCIPPGARLILRDILSDIQSEFEVHSIEIVTFTQLDLAENRYRDAVRFGNGSELSLQRLANGQRVTVVSLGSDAANDVSPGNRGSLVRLFG